MHKRSENLILCLLFSSFSLALERFTICPQQLDFIRKEAFVKQVTPGVAGYELAYLVYRGMMQAITGDHLGRIHLMGRSAGFAKHILGSVIFTSRFIGGLYTAILRHTPNFYRTRNQRWSPHLASQQFFWRSARSTHFKSLSSAARCWPTTSRL